MGFLRVLAGLTALMVVCGVLPYTDAKTSNRDLLVCYWGTWSHYRWAEGYFSVEHIDPFACTHLIYSFSGLHEETGRMYSLDAWLDLGEGEVDPLAPPSNQIGGLDMMRRTVALKKINPDLKVLLAVGGWNEGSEKYSDMVASPAKRQNFTYSAAYFMSKYGFDGLDLDWEYPTQRGGRPEDRENFVTLINELRANFDSLDLEDGRRLLITSAFGCSKDVIDEGYDVPGIAENLDYFFLMTYDFRVYGNDKPGDNLINHHAVLHPKEWEDETNRTRNVQWSVDYFLELGAPPEKVALGVPIYGRTYLLRSPEETNFYDDCHGPGKGGKFTSTPGYMAHFEYCVEHDEQGAEWTHRYDNEYEAAYAYTQSNWLGYENEESIRKKVEFAKQRNLAGVMVWSIEQDNDFRVNCTAPNIINYIQQVQNN